jgi:hypothetical protein
MSILLDVWVGDKPQSSNRATLFHRVEAKRIGHRLDVDFSGATVRSAPWESRVLDKGPTPSRHAPARVGIDASS